MKRIIWLAVLVVLPIFSFAQETAEKEEVKVKFSGFVKNDFFFDSRKTVSAREGHFMLWPAAINEDGDKVDKNAVPSFNFLSVQSRLGAAISGGTAFGAKVSAKIEGDFFGQANDNINLLRLRHAFVKMNWDNTELLMGQYWIPMFITACFPGTVSFSTGVPFQPFGRNPQIRLTHSMGSLKFVAIASAQRDYASRGAVGVTSDYLRNSATPELSAQAHFTHEKMLFAGLGVSYKNIMPQTVTPAGYATTEKVGGFNLIAYTKLKLAPVTIKLEGVYGQNIPDVLSIGGFGVSELIDATRYDVKYAPFVTRSAWVDIHTNGKKVQAGVFAGYTENLGATKDIAESVLDPIYGLGTNLKNVFRVSPRVIFNSGKARFALEGEYSVANYGADRDTKGMPTDLTAANNLRVLAAVYYFF